MLIINLISYKKQCVVPENIHTPPTEGIGNSWGVGGSQRPKNLKKCMRLGMDILWITTQCFNILNGDILIENIPTSLTYSDVFSLTFNIYPSLFNSGHL